MQSDSACHSATTTRKPQPANIMEHYLMATPDLDTSLVTPSASSTAFNSLPFMNSSFSSPLFDFGDILFPPSQNLDFLFPFTDTPVGTPMVPTPFPVSGISGADLFLANLDQQPFTGIQQLTNPFNPSHYDDDLNITFSAPETPVSQTPILKPAPPSNTIQSCTATTSTQSTKYQHPPRHRIFMEPQETPFRISTASRPATPNRSISHPQPNPFTSQIKRYQRTPIPREQKLRLKELFVQDPYPKPAQMAEIAQELGLEKLKVRIWFQNQRACGKRSSLTE